MTHFELRDYDAVIGRWMNPDPMRQYASPYVAMGNNPVNLVDPDGGEAGDEILVNGGDCLCSTVNAIGEHVTFNAQQLGVDASSMVDFFAYQATEPISPIKPFENSSFFDFQYSGIVIFGGHGGGGYDFGHEGNAKYSITLGSDLKDHLLEFGFVDVVKEYFNSDKPITQPILLPTPVDTIPDRNGKLYLNEHGVLVTENATQTIIWSNDSVSKIKGKYIGNDGQFFQDR